MTSSLSGKIPVSDRGDRSVGGGSDSSAPNPSTSTMMHSFSATKEVNVSRDNTNNTFTRENNNNNNNNSTFTREYTVPREHRASLDTTHSKISLPLNTPNTAMLPLSSLSAGRSSAPLYYGRRKGGPMTLYVRAGSMDSSSSENDNDNDSRRGGKGSNSKNNNNNSNNKAKDSALVPANNTEINGSSQTFRGALELGSRAAHNVKDFFPVILQPTQKRRYITEALVFIFFLVVFIFLLHVAKERTEWMSKVAGYDNEQNLMVTASLTEQLLAKANEANELMIPFKRTSPAVVEKASISVKELTDLRDASLKQLHSRMAYPGPVEDIKFLIEEHVAYKTNLARMIKEELKWLDEKKKEYLEKSNILGDSVVRIKKEKKSKKETEQEKVQKKEEKQKVVLQSTPEIKKKSINLGNSNNNGLLEFIISSLKNRVVATVIVFILLALYFRLM